jgi:hypothetical protein
MKHVTPSFPVLRMLTGMIPHNGSVETPEFFELDPPAPGAPPSPGYARPAASDGLWAAGERITWIAGLILALSSFMDWYAGSGVGVKLAVIGWHSGVLGKLVFFIGLAVLALWALREAGFELPAAVPESLILIGLGSLATTFVLIRLISVPDEFFPYTGRGIGLWISLVSALAVIAAGLLEASEEL